MNSGLRKALRGDVVEAAHALLGCELVRGERRARIVEVEAYRGRDDPGSHAFRGMTPRNQVMYGEAGHAYVYFTYGCHWMLNVVAEEEGEAAAVLIRAAEPIAGVDLMRLHRPKAARDRDLLSGPGKLAAAFEIERADNGMDLLASDASLRLLEGPQPKKVLAGTRIGLAVGKGDRTLWRFADSSALPWVSRPLTFG
jgi:DNA-3-methyladenine glycosylase